MSAVGSYWQAGAPPGPDLPPLEVALVNAKTKATLVIR